MDESRLSVIVPVYNDAEGLQTTLRSLVDQDYPQALYEVIAVDNGSTDGTYQVAAQFATAHPRLVRALLEDAAPGSYAARNLGIRSSTGDILCFIDADMTVDRCWASSVAKLFASHPHNYVGFGVEITTDEPTRPALFNKMTGFPIAAYVSEAGFAITAALAVRREVIDKVGPFDSRLMSGGDKEFGNRVRDAGYSLHYEPSIVMRHPARSTYRALMKKSVRIGRGMYQLQSTLPERYGVSDRITWKFLLPPSPGRYVARFRHSDVWLHSTRPSRVLYYLISWSERVAVLLGYVFEAISTRTRAHESRLAR